MPVETVTFGTVGPFPFDEPSNYAVSTTGQLHIEGTPTEDQNVMRLEDIANLVLSNTDPLSVETVAAPGTALVASRADHVHPGENLDDPQDIVGIKNFVNGIKLAGNEILLTYDEGSFTITATGFTTSVTGVAKYIIVGKLVTLFIPTLGGTSNLTTFTLTGLPAAITPANTEATPATGFDNTLAVDVTVVPTGASTTITLSRGVGPSGAWTAAGIKGINAITISYLLT